MRCPHCKSQSTYKHGPKQQWQQSYVCLACQRSFQKRSKTPWILGGVACFGLLPFLIHGGLQAMSGNPDDGQPVDAIVVLGRGPALNRGRAIAVSQLWQDNRAPKVFVSGMMDAPILMKMLQQMGIPQKNLHGERCSQTTWENGLFSDVLLVPLKVKRILLVTDPAHMARAASVFRGFGFEVIPSPAVSDMAKSQWSWREFAGIISYGFTGKFSPANSTQARKNQAEAHYKIQSWGCRLT